MQLGMRCSLSLDGRGPGEGEQKELLLLCCPNCRVASPQGGKEPIPMVFGTRSAGGPPAVHDTQAGHASSLRLPALQVTAKTCHQPGMRSGCASPSSARGVLLFHYRKLSGSSCLRRDGWY